MSAFTSLDDAEQPQLRTLIENAAQAAGASADPDQRKIGDLYAGFLDEANLEQLGAKPLQAEFATDRRAQGQVADPGTDRPLQPDRRGRAL